MIIGYDHCALVAKKDVARLAEWYQTVLGAREWKWSDNRRAVVLAIGERQYVEIMPANEQPRRERDASDCGLNHLALRVDNLEAAIKELDKKQVCWTNEISPALGGGRLRNFSDPDGNLLQLVER